MIPLTVHQLWISPDSDDTGKIPADIQRNVAGWQQHHPTVNHKVWRIRELESLLSDVNGMDVLSAIRVCRFPTMQSNLVRLSLLITMGGFWSDLKNVVLKPFLESLQSEELILCEHQPMPNQQPAGYLTNSFLGARPQNAFLIDCLREGMAGVAARKTGSLSGVTGLVLMNRLMNERRKNGNVPPHRLLSRQEAWAENMRRVGASYQKDGKHWSVLQKTEPLYFD